MIIIMIFFLKKKVIKTLIEDKTKQTFYYNKIYSNIFFSFCIICSI